MKAKKHVFSLLFSLFLYEEEPEPEPGKEKIPGAGAGQECTGSATLALSEEM